MLYIGKLGCKIVLLKHFLFRFFNTGEYGSFPGVNNDACRATLAISKS